MCLDDPGFDVRSLVTNFSATLDTASDGYASEDSSASRDSGYLNRKEKARIQFMTSSLASAISSSKRSREDSDGRPPLPPAKRDVIAAMSSLMQIAKNDSETQLLDPETKSRFKVVCNKMAQKQLDAMESMMADLEQ